MKAFIEVKNVTLSRKKGIAEFPDAITSRGLKHIKELIKANKKGYKIYILYLIQRNDCKFFKIADDLKTSWSILKFKVLKSIYVSSGLPLSFLTDALMFILSTRFGRLGYLNEALFDTIFISTVGMVVSDIKPLIIPSTLKSPEVSTPSKFLE